MFVRIVIKVMCVYQSYRTVGWVGASTHYSCVTVKDLSASLGHIWPMRVSSSFYLPKA